MECGGAIADFRRLIQQMEHAYSIEEQSHHRLPEQHSSQESCVQPRAKQWFLREYLFESHSDSCRRNTENLRHKTYGADHRF